MLFLSVILSPLNDEFFGVEAVIRAAGAVDGGGAKLAALAAARDSKVSSCCVSSKAEGFRRVVFAAGSLLIAVAPFGRPFVRIIKGLKGKEKASLSPLSSEDVDHRQ